MSIGDYARQLSAAAGIAMPPVPLPLNTNMVLDGRYLRAFNGPGISAMNAAGLDTTGGSTLTGHPLTELGNFRYNGNIFQNVITGA